MIKEEILGRNFHLIIDTVDGLNISKIYHRKSPFYNQTIWTLKCKENEIKVLEHYLNNKDFLEMLKFNEKGSFDVLGKKFRFTIKKKGRYLINAEEIVNDEK
ncbi:MAG: hypothetical protein AD073_000313 [Mycoplasmataceae bacterium]|nr:MAG: hypothetical protein AD073_000313 [Mycoplasmataceae bacterium]